MCELEQSAISTRGPEEKMATLGVGHGSRRPRNMAADSRALVADAGPGYGSLPVVMNSRRK